MNEWTPEDMAELEDATGQIAKKIASELGESPEAWRGAVVMLGRVGQIVFVGTKEMLAGDVPADAEELAKGVANAMVVMSSVAMQFEAMPQAKMAREAQGWPKQ